jgi:site-specific DNA-methyltransferase (adenine-specific)
MRDEIDILSAKTGEGVMIDPFYTGDDSELYLGDCLDILPCFSSNSIDMVLTDPPYGTTQCKWDSIISLKNMWKELIRIVKSDGAIVFTSAQPFTTKLISSNYKMFKYCWYWDKVLPRGHLNAKKQPLRVIEDIPVFYSKQVIYNPQKTSGHKRKKAHTVYNKEKGSQVYGQEKRNTMYDSSKRYPKGLIKISTANQMNKCHPTQKPVELMEYLIKTYTNENELVLDFTMGSGTTGVACINTKRRFLGVEKDEKYCEISFKRIIEAQRRNS